MNTNKTTTKKTGNKNYNGRNNSQKNFNDKVKYAAKEARLAEVEQKRETSYEFLTDVCAALDARIKVITDLRQNAADPKTISRELTMITLSDISNWFKDNGKEFPEKTAVNTLVSILIDLARLQVNTKLMDYHVAIRLIYFSEKFQAFFSTKYNEKRDELTFKYTYLFNTWNSGYVTFSATDDFSDGLCMPVNAIGVDSE